LKILEQPYFSSCYQGSTTYLSVLWGYKDGETMLWDIREDVCDHLDGGGLFEWRQSRCLMLLKKDCFGTISHSIGILSLRFFA
jgi:hypothetical protein